MRHKAKLYPFILEWFEAQGGYMGIYDDRDIKDGSYCIEGHYNLKRLATFIITKMNKLEKEQNG